MLGLIQSYCLNTIYFDIDASNHHQHAIRRHIMSSCLWLAAHLPFVMGFTLSGAALSRLVVAHDCPNADVDSLTETYVPSSAETIETGIRWFYCGGLALAMVCLAMISVSHLHRDVATQRIKKKNRLAYRIVVALVWILLPLAGDKLNSLQLVSITAGMTVSVLAVDIYGTSCRCDSFFSFRKDCKQCYTARMIPTVGANSDGDIVDGKGNNLVGEKGYIDIS